MSDALIMASVAVIVLLLFCLCVKASFAEDDLISCPKAPRWFACPRDGRGLCVSRSQLCDGRSDCIGSGWDETKEVCKERPCAEGAVRCAEADVCLNVPHRHVCNGE